MSIPRIMELVSHFKYECQSRGWESSKHEDWVKVGNEYHNFLWTRIVRPNSFKKIVKGRKCAIRQGETYTVINVDYTAWLFSEAPSEELLQIMEEDPGLLGRTALYDLSWIDSEKPTCLKLNQTNSRVFKEFEDFLEEKRGVRIKPIIVLLSQQA